MDKTNALERDNLKKKYRVDHTVLKADTHIHISAAYSQGELVERIKRANSRGAIQVSPDILLKKEATYYSDFLQFHKQYEELRPLTKPDDLCLVNQGYLENFSRQGGIVVQLSNSFRDEAQFEAQLENIVAGIEAAHRNTGIEARIIVTTLRDHGPKQAMKALNYLKAHPNPYVTEFGLVGDEFSNDFLEFERPLNVAFHEVGLGISPHTGEQSLNSLVDYAEIIQRNDFSVKSDDQRRVRGAHGVLMYLIPELIDIFNENEIAWEMPLSAHKSIDLSPVTKQIKIGDTFRRKTLGEITVENPLRDYFNNIKNHPLMYLKERGLKMTMGSDNPVYMYTSGGKQYSIAVKAGWKKSDAHEFTGNAIETLSLDGVARFRLQQRYKEYLQALKGKLPPGYSGGYVDSKDLDISFG